jgi:GGDEF domain-containing protein
MSEGKALFDAYRKEQGAFANALAQRREALAERIRGMTAGRVGLELAVFLAILLLALRQHRALRDSIVAPVAALLQHIRRVRDGQLEATIAPAGPHELAELGQGLNEMVRSLATAREIAASRDDALREHSLRLRQILDASREFSESLNLKYVVRSVRESTVTVGGYERAIVWLMDDEQSRLIDSDESGAHTPSSSDDDARFGLAQRAAKSGRITFEGPTGQVRFRGSSVGPIRAIAIPLIVGARVVGVLEARHAEAQAATKDVIEILEMLATHAATAIESARLHEVVEERSQMDALTRLFNRRRLDEDLDAECRSCLRYGRPLAFVMLDVDHFKAFNDSHGHPQVDKALQEVAEVITGCVRTTDTPYRYGGEEFCVVLRETKRSRRDAVRGAGPATNRASLRVGRGARYHRIPGRCGVLAGNADISRARRSIRGRDVDP